MRKGAEHNGGRREISRLPIDELDFALANAELFAPLVVRGRECEVKARVLHQKRAQLTSGIAASAKYTDRDSIHELMHNNTCPVGQSLGGCR
jgi:hypothetical protein